MIEQLSSGGFPLGILPSAQFEVGQTQLQHGESLIVYSDGVTEANNLQEEEFGIDRLSEVVRRNLNASAAGLRDRVESALSTFTQTAPANDDITLVIAKRV
jgi:sigma-B regulation protein RsbU (phosphoserine phosphatase)